MSRPTSGSDERLLYLTFSALPLAVNGVAQVSQATTGTTSGLASPQLSSFVASSDYLESLALQENEGKVEKLQVTEEKPFGDRSGDNPLCRQFQGDNVRNIAVVGNGPLGDDQRAEIEASDVVVR